MRSAKGFATGKGLRVDGGVEGSSTGVVDEGSACSGKGPKSKSQTPKFGGGIVITGGGSAGWDGREACGEGGGKTNAVERREFAEGISPSRENASEGRGGRISVSPAGMTFFGEPRDVCVPREAFGRLEGFLGKAFLGDLKPDFRGDCLWILCRAGEAGRRGGVGDRSGIIFSISQDRFSSMNFMRSAWSGTKSAMRTCRSIATHLQCRLVPSKLGSSLCELLALLVQTFPKPLESFPLFISQW